MVFPKLQKVITSEISRLKAIATYTVSKARVHADQQTD
jgi:hypothetical protein